MKEKFVVYSDAAPSEAFDTEAEAVARAKEALFELREAAGEDGGWGPLLIELAESICVIRNEMLYQARQCDVQEPTEKQKAEGYEFACDYQMFPVEEEPELADTVGAPDPAIEYLHREAMHQLIEHRERALRGFLTGLLKGGCVSAFGCDGIDLINETFDFDGLRFKWNLEGYKITGAVKTEVLG